MGDMLIGKKVVRRKDNVPLGICVAIKDDVSYLLIMNSAGHLNKWCVGDVRVMHEEG